MNRLKGVIFDFNGILLWDTHLHEEVWKNQAVKIRGRQLTDHEIQTMVHGRTNTSMIEYLAGKRLTEAELQRHIQDKETAYQQMCLDRKEEFKLAPGAIEFLDYLKAQGVPMTIGTSSGIGNLKFYFEHLDLAKWFGFDNVAYDNLTVKGKPAPDLYLIAAKKLSLAPKQCIILEDAISGIAAAHAAGAGKIIAMGPLDKHALLAAQPGVDQVVSDFHELLSDRDNLWRSTTHRPPHLL